MTFHFLLIWLALILVPDVKAPISPKPVTPKDFLISSDDGGQSWHGLSQGIPTDTRANTFLATDDTWFLGAEEGIFLGHSTIPIAWKKDLLQEISITSIVPGKSGPYAVSHWRGFYQFQYSSGQWNPMHLSLKDKTVHSVLEATNGILYSGCETGIYRSTDRGASWKLVHNPGAIHKLLESNGAILAISNDRLWRSSDGNTWTRAMSNAKAPFYVTAANTELIAITRGEEFAGMRLGNDIFRSTDNGITWSPILEHRPQALGGIFELKQVGNAWIAASNTGIYRSSDNGITWTQVVASPEENRGVFYKLYVIEQQLIALRIAGC